MPARQPPANQLDAIAHGDLPSLGFHELPPVACQLHHFHRALDVREQRRDCLTPIKVAVPPFRFARVTNANLLLGRIRLQPHQSLELASGRAVPPTK
jgi:hypothetical protein